jgi:hypothetical protein
MPSSIHSAGRHFTRHSRPGGRSGLVMHRHGAAKPRRSKKACFISLLPFLSLTPLFKCRIVRAIQLDSLLVPPTGIWTPAGDNLTLNSAGIHDSFLVLIACRIVHSQHLRHVLKDPRVAGPMPAAAGRIAEALLSEGRVTVQRHNSPNPRFQSHPLVRSALTFEQSQRCR